jgi:hypothetical protein
MREISRPLCCAKRPAVNPHVHHINQPELPLIHDQEVREVERSKIDTRSMDLSDEASDPSQQFPAASLFVPENLTKRTSWQFFVNYHLPGDMWHLGDQRHPDARNAAFVQSGRIASKAHRIRTQQVRGYPTLDPEQFHHPAVRGFIHFRSSPILFNEPSPAKQ